jgi:L-threonylcarbamoyladenylate synthase
VASRTPKTIQIRPGREADPAALERAVSALAAGELVIVPTETVYGVAADPRVPGAMERLYLAKGRSAEKPVALLAADREGVAGVDAAWTPAAEALARRWWPGPLTLVLKAGGGFQGLRVPDHPVARALLRRLGAPLAVSSANRSGEPASVTAEQAVKALGAEVAVALDAGPSPGGVPSTVVKVAGDRVEVLREGGIRPEAIESLLEEIRGTAP